MKKEKNIKTGGGKAYERPVASRIVLSTQGIICQSTITTDDANSIESLEYGSEFNGWS